MKVWLGYGTEHSMNLVMIGQFEDSKEAAQALSALEHIKERVNDDEESGLLEVGNPPDRYTEGMMKLLGDIGSYSLHPGEFEQFVYDVGIELNGDTIVITTDEADVSAFLKVLISKRARVEVYSAHFHTDTDYGRGSAR